MKSNNNSVSSLQYHIVWCTKYRHPILTGAVEVETKTVLAQTCTEYGWTLKAIEVMPDHVHLFLEASPDDAPSSIARTHDEMPGMWQGYGQRSCHIFKQHALQHKCHVQT